MLPRSLTFERKACQWLLLAAVVMLLALAGLRPTYAHDLHAVTTSAGPVIADAVPVPEPPVHPCEPGNHIGHLSCAGAAGFSLGPTTAVVLPSQRVTAVVEPDLGAWHPGRDIAPPFHPPKRSRPA